MMTDYKKVVTDIFVKNLIIIITAKGSTKKMFFKEYFLNGGGVDIPKL